MLNYVGSASIGRGDSKALQPDYARVQVFRVPICGAQRGFVSSSNSPCQGDRDISSTRMVLA